MNRDPNNGGAGILDAVSVGHAYLQEAISIVWVPIKSLNLHTYVLSAIHISVYMRPGTQR